MSNKTIGIFLGIIVIAVIGLFAYSTASKNRAQKAAQEAINIDTTQTGEMPEENPQTNKPADRLKDATLNLTPENTKLAWIGRKTLVAGYEDAGSIDIKSGQVSFAEGKIVSAEAVLDIASIKALTTGRGDGQDRLSNHLKSADFFDAEKFPEGYLKITKAEPGTQTAAGTQYDFSGQLTLKNITQPITFSGLVTLENGQAAFSAETKLDRTLWEINYGSSKLADSFIDDFFTLKINSVVAIP